MADEGPLAVVLMSGGLDSCTTAALAHQEHRLGAPVHLTWSCYHDEPVACGRCESCVLRLKGFEEAGLTDPVAYKTTST